MPIGDLLAQISGDKSQSTSPAPMRPHVVTSAKRKADDDLRNMVSNKTPRTSTTGPSSSSASKSAGTSRPAARPAEKTSTITGYRGSAARPLDRTSSAPKPPGNGNPVSKSTSSNARPLNGSGPPRVTSTLPSRPSPAAPALAKGGPAPKKGSFAEILARAKKAQESMGQVGKIQHKPVEKILTKKEREELAKEAKREAKVAAVKGGVARQSSKFQGTSRPSAAAAPSRNGASSHGAPRNGVLDRSKDPKAAASARGAEEEHAKRFKKAAVATTGYSGTARPRPGSASTKKTSAPGGALLNARPAPRYGGSAKRSRYDEDEELDDFIEYDDEEDAGGPRYAYDSDDGSSDMEAGMDDVWEEEQTAERVARREDLEEERLEKRLKAEKEERKRKFWEQQQRARR